MKIDSVSYGVASKVVKTFAMTATRIRGYCNTANEWLHVFDAKTVPATGTVPKRSYPIYTTAPFDIMLADEPLDFANGMVVAISSTQATFTASANTMDLFVTGESSIDDTGWTVAGDYTTADEVLQVWADADGPKKLVRLEVSDKASAIGPFFVQVHAADAPATDKIVASFECPASGSLDLFFGGGLDVLRTTMAARYDGCTIALSATESTYTAAGANCDFIRATYK